MAGNPFTADPRFAEKVAVGAPDECWEWQASRDGNNYGMYCLPRSQGGQRKIKAHRYGLSLVTGKRVPRELVVDHLCRNPPCCNPAHLEPVTQAENMARSPLQRKPGTPAPCGEWQAAKTHCPQGHAYDERNTGRRPNGHRYCRACARDRMRRKKAAFEDVLGQIVDETGRTPWATA